MKSISIALIVTCYFFIAPVHAQLAQPASYAAGEVVFFRDNNYLGPCVVRTTGNYPNTAGAGFPNDWVSSVKMGTYVQVRLFENANFEGNSIVVKGNNPNLSTINWNDKVSSFKVERIGSPGNNPSANTVMLFKDKDFTGASVELEPGYYYNPADFGLGDNAVSSFKMGSNTEMVVFADEYMQGQKRVFTTSVNNLSASGFNDRISSVYIRKKNATEAYLQNVPENASLVHKVLSPLGNMKKLPRMTRDVVGIVFDQHDPGGNPATAYSLITLKQMMQSVSDYYKENSDGRFTLRVAGVLGPYSGSSTFAQYNQTQNTDTDGDGFLFGPWKKYKDAIVAASQQYDFSKFDRNGDHKITKDELTISILVPGQYARGFQRDALNRQVPSSEKLKVNGVEISDPIIELYLAPNFADESNKSMLSHELSHQFLGHVDYYPCAAASDYVAGSYSIMDNASTLTHLDPLVKLKSGWLLPKVITTSGYQSLEAVETGHSAWILMNPAKGTDEYFIIENRNGQQGSFDRSLRDGGLAIWHIIENKVIWEQYGFPAGNDCKDWGRKGVGLIRATTPANDASALWKGPAFNQVVLRWANSQNGGFELRDISSAGKFMSAKIYVL